VGTAGVPSPPDCDPGPHVELAVTDNGCGMDDTVRERAFEPFFTTRAGTGASGLGLAVVYGVVRQHQGCVAVASEPGRGATLRVLLPLQSVNLLPRPAHVPKLPAAALGNEVVLVVEDEDQVRRLVVIALERSGYTVLEAASPVAALDIVGRTPGTIDLLLTDVIMPVMDGAELQRRILRIRPDIKTVFMSGYASHVMGEHGVLDDGVCFVQKPFSVADLTRKVREVLDRPV
jgi:CheY-like chemotaxis protein